MASLPAVDVKTIGRALAALPGIDRRGSKRTGGCYMPKAPNELPHDPPAELPLRPLAQNAQA